MPYTRREIGRLALTALPAAALLEYPFAAGAGRADASRRVIAQTRKPNSVIGGVRIGTITYSYRSMPDQSAEATLRYILESGISQIELMNGPAESFAGRRRPDAAAEADVVAAAVAVAAAVVRRRHPSSRRRSAKRPSG